MCIVQILETTFEYYSTNEKYLPSVPAVCCLVWMLNLPCNCLDLGS